VICSTPETWVEVREDIDPSLTSLLDFSSCSSMLELCLWHAQADCPCQPLLPVPNNSCQHFRQLETYSSEIQQRQMSPEYSRVHGTVLRVFQVLTNPTCPRIKNSLVIASVSDPQRTFPTSDLLKRTIVPLCCFLCNHEGS
jgi:hypothetical protein